MRGAVFQAQIAHGFASGLVVKTGLSESVQQKDIFNGPDVDFLEVMMRSITDCSPRKLL